MNGDNTVASAGRDVRQLDSVGATFLTGLVGRTPMLAGAEQVTFLDLEDAIRETHGYAEQRAGYGYNKVEGLDALIAAVSTPVVAASRLRKGSVNSARGCGQAAHRDTEHRPCMRGRRSGRVRAGARSRGLDVLQPRHRGRCPPRRGGAQFSITARMDPAIRRAIAAISESAWTAIRYPQAIWGEEGECWISDAEVAEIDVTAFTSHRKADHVTARLIVRRVERLNPESVPAGQSELFGAYRYHAVFTGTDQPTLQAEATHRKHAIVEQVIADPEAGPLAHLPSGSFAANSAWLVLAAIRAQLIAVPLRLARSARWLGLHFSERWPWEQAWAQLFDATCGPQAAA